MVAACTSLRLKAALLACLVSFTPGVALANDGAADGASAPDDSASEVHLTIGRGQDLVGRPIDIVAASRRAIAAAAAVAAAAGKTGLAIGRGAVPNGMPVSATYLTSGFGMRYHPLLGIVREHDGVDLAAPTGSPIVATSDGVIGQAGWRGGYGLSVEIEHGAGVESRYGHMSRIAVYPGQQVHRGDVIGYVGSTGLSTGPHLHYEVRINGAPVNPQPLLRGR